MKIKIQSVKFDADKKLVDFIEEKVSKLERFSDDIMNSEIILKLDKDHEHGNKVAVLKIEVRGEELVSERRNKSFEESVDQCIDAVKKQIEKHKAKLK